MPGEDGALLALADGFAPQFVSAPAEKRQINVGLTTGQTVRGVIRDASGQPIEGAEITPVVRCPDTGLANRIWLNERVGHSDKQGDFEVAAVPEDALFDILKPGYSDLRDLSLALNGKPNEIDLVAGGAIRGRVVDAAAKPVRNFKIRVMILRDLRRRRARASTSPDSSGMELTSPATTACLSSALCRRATGRA